MEAMYFIIGIVTALVLAAVIGSVFGVLSVKSKVSKQDERINHLELTTEEIDRRIEQTTDELYREIESKSDKLYEKLK